MASPLNRGDLYVGRLVQVIDPSNRYNGRYYVMKINPKNIKLEPEDGGRGLNCSPSFIYEVGAAANPTAINAYNADPVWPKGITLGTVIEFPEGFSSRIPGGPDFLYVVIAMKTERINVAPLNGDGKYWRVPSHMWDKMIPLAVDTAITL